MTILLDAVDVGDKAARVDTQSAVSRSVHWGATISLYLVTSQIRGAIKNDAVLGDAAETVDLSVLDRPAPNGVYAQP